MRKTWIAAALAVSGFIAGAAQADTFKVDPVHSSVLFKIRHLNVGNSVGRFNDLGGTIVTDDGKESIEASVAVDKVDTNNAKRDQHLKSEDFFNAAQFPQITFKSTSIKKSDDGWDVTGDLTLHGVTKSVTVNLKKLGEADTMAKHRLGLEGTLTVKRSEFGMTKMLEAVGDDVTLYINIEAVRD
jgi:polyisoprenoid-binding protein YceI